jgi:hypothetical protein
MKKLTKVLSLMCILATMVSLLVLPASAVNDEDVYYYYLGVSATGDWEYTNARFKVSTSKVYVYPITSPSSYTKCRTMCYSQTVNSDGTRDMINKTGTNRGASNTTTVILSSGQKYAITNYVYEDGYNYNSQGVMMWLNLLPTSSTGTLYGCWSPDTLNATSYQTIGG